MDTHDLRARLADLAATTVDDPGLLSDIHRAARRTHRRRAALVGGSALAVVGGAVAVAAGGFPSTGHPFVPAGPPRTTTTTQPAPAPSPRCAAPATAAAGAAPVTIVSWTGVPPAVGQSFDVTGTVATATASSVTVTLNAGALSGTVTLTTQGFPATVPPSGATVELGGTRTGQGAYDVSSVGITSHGVREGFKISAAAVAAGQAGAVGGPTIVSWTGAPPAVGQGFTVTGTVTAATASTVTVGIKGGDASGTVTLTTQGGAPGVASSGATVTRHLARPPGW